MQASLHFFLFGLVCYPPMQIPESKFSGVCSFWPVHFCNSPSTANLRQIKIQGFSKKVDKSLKRAKVLAPWMVFQGLGLERALMDDLFSDPDALSLPSPMGYYPHCRKVTLAVHLCRPFHLSGRRHKNSCRKTRVFFSTCYFYP